MRGLILITVGLSVGGCAVNTRPQSFSYPDYSTMSCGDLSKESQRLARETANRSEHLLENDRERRASAAMQLKSVKKAATEKSC